MSDAHQQFLENPEANMAHLDTCAECRAVFSELEAPVNHSPVAMKELPLATWEGASHRAWGFIAVSTILLFILAAALMVIAKVPPARLLTAATSLAELRLMLTAFSNGLRHAALVWQIVFVLAVIAVNSLLFVLLRRPPRGIDA
jgi:hypothetical protein